MSDWKTVKIGDVCETLQGDCSMKAAEFKKLGDYVKIKTGKLDANASSDDGEYPFFTCSIEPLKISSFSYDCECCLVAGNGDLNVKYYNGKFDAYQRTYIIESLDKEKLDVMYLYFFLCSYIEVLRKQSIGGVIKYIKLGNLTDALIPIPSLEKQKKICRNLIKAQKVLNENQALFSKYDILIKSRFIEMFGDNPTENGKWNIEKIEDVCTVTSSKRIYAEEQSTTGVPFLRISDLVSRINGNPINDLFIPNSKFKEFQTQGLVPSVNDILITSRGTLGLCYIIKPEDEFYFQDGMITWLAFKNHNKVLSVFIDWLFKSILKTKIDNETNGATVKYVSISDLKKLQIPVPPLELQNDFAAFVQQIDKSKFAVQKSLEKAETLYKSLMQEYFN